MTDAMDYPQSDVRRHAPDLADPSWQESLFIGWFDPEASCAGHHRIGLRPGRQDAVVWSVALQDGAVVGRSQQLVSPCPVEDYDDLRAGALRVRAASHRQLTLTADFPDARVELDYQAICGPAYQRWNLGGLQLAKGHYETMGYARGLLTAGGRETPIRGRAWHDHSWGPRCYYPHRAGRWLFALFEDDLAISAFTYATPDGQRCFGWIHDRGEVTLVENARFNGIVDDDGVTPLGCDAVVTAAGGRAYRVRGEVRASALVGDSDWWSMEGMAVYDCDGRKGAGLLELNELKTLPDRLKRQLQPG